MTQHNICTEVTEADHAMINVRHAVSILWERKAA